MREHLPSSKSGQSYLQTLFVIGASSQKEACSKDTTGYRAQRPESTGAVLRFAATIRGSRESNPDRAS